MAGRKLRARATFAWNPRDEFDATEIVQKILSAVVRTASGSGQTTLSRY